MISEIKRFINQIRIENGGFPIGVKIVFVIFIFMFIRKIIFFRGDLFEIIINIIILVLSLLFHELGHGYMAKLLGDKTAERYGRLSLNPLKHLDPLGTILPIIMIIMGSSMVIGWAKPVPINYNNLKNGKRGEILVAIGGVFINFLIALVSTMLFYSHISDGYFKEILLKVIMINLTLCAFNLIPIPPLDGSRIVASFLDNYQKRQIFLFDRYGFLLIMVLSYLGILDRIIRVIISGEIFLIENIVRLI